jgi:uncharacterized membrane protein YbhN (UPF0104 family)
MAGLGVACGAATLLYVGLTAILRRPVVIKRWQIALPPPRLALGQVLAGSINYAFVAAALYNLLPPGIQIGYFGVAAVYVVGNAASIVSHVPGGLGVLEAVVMHLVPQATVVAALVVFRALYFLVPFVIGLVLLAIHEILQRRTRRGPSAV